ncbi:solute carrier family 25 member 32-like [Tubulanus polymorphus]|uniref:solute carrier family 25 member 32-like n=1 Tax=Tubulanus polymorphus TaxID=672921 RepID=UPI003DA27794
MSGVQAAEIEKRRSLSGGVFSHVKWEHLAAGVSGGVASTLALHPLDLLKVRFQVNEGHGPAKRPVYYGMLHALRSIYVKDGVRGLYAGVVPNVWGAGSAWGFYFFFYNAGKNWMQSGDLEYQLRPSQHMTAAAGSGLMTLVITNPIWVTKTRLCLQYDRSLTAGTSSGQTVANTRGVYYKGMFDALVKIGKTEGIAGLYKGFLPGAFGVSHGALQFMAYEEMKNLYNNYRNTPINTKLNPLEYIVFAALSKIFAASSTYPYQVVRSRLQDQHRRYNGILHVIKETWRFEGVYGFYKGLAPSLLRVTPACCITFVVYENVISSLLKKS